MSASAWLTEDEAVRSLRAVELGWSPWLSPGGRVDGGARPSPAAPPGPSVAFTPTAERVLVCGSRRWALTWRCPRCRLPVGVPCVGRWGVHDERHALAAEPIEAELAKLCPLGSTLISGVCGISKGDPLDVARMVGPDRYGFAWALAHGHVLGETLVAFPADWSKGKGKGKRAGGDRNAEQLREGRPTKVLACNVGAEGTAGTNDMSRKARAAGVEVLELRR